MSNATILAVGLTIGLIVLAIRAIAHGIRRAQRALSDAWDQLIAHVANIDSQIQEIRGAHQERGDESAMPRQTRLSEDPTCAREPRDPTNEPARVKTLGKVDDREAREEVDDETIGELPFPSFTVTPEEWRTLCHEIAHPRVLPEKILNVFRKKPEIDPGDDRK